MHTSELKIIASAYNFDIRGVKSHGMYLTDIKTGRYHRLSDYNKIEQVTREELLAAIRHFSAVIHNRINVTNKKDDTNV